MKIPTETQEIITSSDNASPKPNIEGIETTPKDKEPSSSANSSDFDEYMWMEHEEEFEREVMKQLEEEALMEQCIEAMLNDEFDELEEKRMLESLEKCNISDVAKKSNLNPNAAEFVPKSSKR